VLWFGDENVGNDMVRYLDPGYGVNGAVAGTDLVSMVAPRAGTLRNMFARHHTALGNGKLVTYKVLINGAAPAGTLVVSLASGGIGQDDDLFNTVAVAQGDRISIEITKPEGAIGNANTKTTLSMEFA
jgi:hypothetical protein